MVHRTTDGTSDNSWHIGQLMAYRTTDGASDIGQFLHGASSCMPCVKRRGGGGVGFLSENVL